MPPFYTDHIEVFSEEGNIDKTDGLDQPFVQTHFACFARCNLYEWSSLCLRDALRHLVLSEEQRRGAVKSMIWHRCLQWLGTLSSIREKREECSKCPTRRKIHLSRLNQLKTCHPEITSLDEQLLRRIQSVLAQPPDLAAPCLTKSAKQCSSSDTR